MQSQCSQAYARSITVAMAALSPQPRETSAASCTRRSCAVPPPPGRICSIWFSALSWAATVCRGAEQCRGTSPVRSTSPASSFPHLQLLSSGVLVRSFENMLQPVAPAASIIHSTATCRHLYSQCWLSCPLLTCIRTHDCQRVIAVLKCSMRMVVVVAEEHKHMKDQPAWQ